MIGIVQEKYKRFKYYLRQCSICDEIFKAYSKNGRRPRLKLCPECKNIINKKRLAKIMETKTRLKELRDELSK